MVTGTGIQGTVVLNTNLPIAYCMQNYKQSRLAPHGPPDASQTIVLDNDLV